MFFENYGLDDHLFFKQLELVNQSFPLHFHRACEIVYVRSGEVDLSVASSKWHLVQGESVLIFPNQLHRIQAINCTLEVIVFSPEWIADFFSEYRGKVPTNPVFLDFPKLLHQADPSPYGIKSSFYQICDQLCNSSHFVSTPSLDQNTVVYNIISYIDQNYMNDISLTSIASHFQYDYAYISKLFIKYTSHKFTDFLNQYRIFQACYLLNQKESGVLEIASEVGYATIRSFNRNFRKVMGVTPTEFKKQQVKSIEKK